MNQAVHHPELRCENSSEISRPGGHYSHVCMGAGQVFISGQLPIRSDGSQLNDASFEDQARQVLANVDACLACAGVERKNLMQVRIYVTDINNWPAFNALYAEWLGAHRPARAVAGVAQLHFGFAVEVEAVALL
ncbi:RidA family protein [Kushneria phyllosphaerae]|uniref:2-iminobutanoate/2-iminopropanoate deaminase n=1 Tax=Kushneria phyllosphaerae TaxID=2100822 RepID=A0A2R8CH86_9GAMM|nr:RidA family protein [Kushneria phyllosphaerae]SPJ32223.1 2-iminobutanoate/2-iminopropanoate deaminase [Kushneria phyllosphaerae]